MDIPASSGGRRITLDPIKETPTEVKLPRARVESLIPAGFRQELASGSYGEDLTFEICFSMTAHLTMLVKRDGRTIAQEVVDSRVLIPAWLDAILQDGET